MTAHTAPPQAAPRQSEMRRMGLPAPARAPGSWRRDTVAAVLWMVAVVPAAMGFWLVAGSLAGVAQSQVSTLISAPSALVIGGMTLAIAGVAVVSTAEPAAEVVGT